MRELKILVFFITCIGIIKPLAAQEINPKFDSALASRLGADDYGMKQYILVILKTGENKTTDKAFIDSCFIAHLRNIERLADLRKIIIAGPFLKNDSGFRGIFILDVKSSIEANELLLTDPAIKEKLLLPELYPWYGSAALPLYLEDADRVWKLNP